MKDKLINELTVALGDVVTIPLSELKGIISISMYNYNVSLIETTEISTTGGEATERLLSLYVMGKASSNITKQSIKQYVNTAKLLCDYTGKDLNMITREDVTFFLYDYKIKHHIKSSTMESKRLYLCSVFSYLFGHEYINKNPMDGVEKIKCEKVIKEPLNAEELARIDVAIESSADPVRNKALFYLMLDTGCRVTELCSINVSDINWSERKIKIFGKGRKERFVYFSEKTSIRIKEYMKLRKDVSFESCFSLDTPLFISNRRHSRLTKTGTEYLIKQLGVSAGIPRIHPHLIRATFATSMFNKGYGVNEIAMLLGHANLNTVTRYILLSEDHIKNSIAQRGCVA